MLVRTWSKILGSLRMKFCMWLAESQTCSYTLHQWKIWVLEWESSRNSSSSRSKWTSSYWGLCLLNIQLSSQCQKSNLMSRINSWQKIWVSLRSRQGESSSRSPLFWRLKTSKWSMREYANFLTFIMRSSLIRLEKSWKVFLTCLL